MSLMLNTGAMQYKADGSSGWQPLTLVANVDLESLADEFSTSSTYEVGEYVRRGGVMYRCITAVTTAGAWDSTKWVEVNIGDELAPKTPTLISTDDTTDRSTEIMTQLASGSCVLGNGVFYISQPIVMPDNSELRGQGTGTKIVRASGASGSCAIQMAKYNNISNLWIDGGLTPSSTIGSVHGISWIGDYSTSEDSYKQPRFGKLSNLHIEKFSGGGIYCNNTGYGTFNNLSVCESTISDCAVGIYIPYWSEFHKFTDVKAYMCYYGCINNGGNNVFVNCDFSTSRTKGFVIDGASGNNPNNAHGSAIGCVINHTANNSGVAVDINDVTNGFVFDGCQIFYGSISITNSKGVQFSNCNCGAITIAISDEGANLFEGCSFASQPTVTQTNNTKTVFSNCYERTNNNPITQFAKKGGFSASTGTSYLNVRQNGKVVSVGGFITGASLTANTSVKLGTITGVSAPVESIRFVGGVAAQAYDHPADVAYMTIDAADFSLRIVSSITGSRAVYFNVTYIVD